jgi:hypothetical protein
MGENGVTGGKILEIYVFHAGARIRARDLLAPHL